MVNASSNAPAAKINMIPQDVEIKQNIGYSTLC
jgi:hypothetical protein